MSTSQLVVDSAIGLWGGYLLGNNSRDDRLLLDLERKVDRTRSDLNHLPNIDLTQYQYLPVIFIAFALYHSGAAREVIGATAVGAIVGRFKLF